MNLASWCRVLHSRVATLTTQLAIQRVPAWEVSTLTESLGLDCDKSALLIERFGQTGSIHSGSLDEDKIKDQSEREKAKIFPCSVLPKKAMAVKQNVASRPRAV